MKILIATESYYPNISGVAVFSHNLAQKMVERGHEVFVIAPSPKFKQYEETCDRVKIYRLPSKINRFRHGYYISKSPYKYVKKIMNEVRPNIVHLQDPALISVATMYQAKRLKIPIVITNHFSLEYITTYLPILRPIHFLILFIMTHYLNWFYAKANILTCPTKTVADRFISSGIKIEVRVISNGVDVSRFMPYYGDLLTARSRWNIPLNKKLVLFVGRLDVDKRVINIILAAPKILSKTYAHFVIVGSGKEKENLKKLVQKQKIKNHFTFIDFIPYNNVLLPEIYQSSSVFVNPCPLETQSIVVLEAEATGLPVVVANSGALVELVKNGSNGYRFKPDDADDLANKVIKILKDDKLAKKMGEKSVEMIEGHIVDDTYNSFEKIYKNIK
jgi:glycosyltransferase involved in cell wall biosynthesis